MPSSVALAYLAEALDHIEARSIMRDRMDWPALRAEAVAQIADAQATAHTYPAIRLALSRLGDNHSHFVTPAQWRWQERGVQRGWGIQHHEGIIVAVFPGGPADRAGIQVRDRAVAVGGAALTSPSDLGQWLSMSRVRQLLFAFSREGETHPIHVVLSKDEYELNRLPTVQRFAGGIGYIEIPGFAGTQARGVEYAITAHSLIREVDRAGVRGWIVDLRLNAGGNMYPMLVGVGPILGEGDAGGFRDADGRDTPFGYRDGTGYCGTHENCRVAGEAYRREPPVPPPVAVLMGKDTVSAGEAIVLAFRGRRQSRSFGEPTRGLPTGNEPKIMSDGARLILTTTRETDRTGIAYDAPIPPDEYVMTDWSQYGAECDPVVRAAAAWLQGIDNVES